MLEPDEKLERLLRFRSRAPFFVRGVDDYERPAEAIPVGFSSAIELEGTVLPDALVRASATTVRRR